MRMTTTTTRRRGDTREDGLRFWRINKGREIWVTPEVFERKSAQDSERSVRRWNTKRLEVQHVARAYYLENRERLLKAASDYRKDNPEKVKEWKRNHMIEHRAERNQAARARYAKDPFLRARILCRDRIYRCLLIGDRSGPIVRKMLGCTPLQLRMHLEERFRDGMSWANYGTLWEVDHIVPLASAKTPEEVFLLSHHTNLQPLLASENLRKGPRHVTSPSPEA